ncbi:hypothetical protein MOK15_06400 [Sphingobium sp. BYY-5]|uniref:hypothetical protein n=1 Tax=Sphingobium sp. BYY-5 TaxID=2926400 RepID=UPI001FA709B0|nr:hypothetical protein [Sphingobium sp. BYY-5]MCI4589720.1 hypothetical protein [Sphingobium sp. BYY-5]
MEDRTLIERLARHLASAEPDHWPVRVEDAASILALLKEPDDAMREAGDPAIWREMIDAALRERWNVARLAADDETPSGSDEEGEIRLTPDTVRGDHAEWVHLHPKPEKRA